MSTRLPAASDLPRPDPYRNPSRTARIGTVESLLPVCPYCGYQRQAGDPAPDWRCPQCERAYNKGAPGPVRSRRRPPGVRPAYFRSQRLLTIVALLAALLAGSGAWNKNRLEPPAKMLAELQRDPLQSPLHRDAFEFAFSGRRYRVAPVAAYELWGLVVSHNNPTGLRDIYHDASSVDTRDLCVVWGDNIQNGAYREASYESGSWTCYFRHDYGVPFRANQLSNNHLITDDPQVRKRLAQIEVGDQIHLQGMLVDYRPADDPRFWRRSSTSRDDTGNTACEVVFLQDLRILRAASPGWRMAYRAGLWILAMLLLLKTGLFAVDILRRRRY
jgi:hypothetical protein